MSVLVIPKAPFPSFTQALLSGGHSARFNVDDDESLDERTHHPASGAVVDLMKTLDTRTSHSWDMTFALNEDDSDTETIFEERPRRTKQCKRPVYLASILTQDLHDSSQADVFLWKVTNIV
ncbi:hypothetical protein JR316_0002999 [Psilocybe cubensis]|uniref:Uncharacterized protein n=1 Tax=Psilocybe cubensis TaxID=181762 RepID=A0ACB8H6K0_PSICU|nr:hypothetical protein JR316_0002999 [Psilocybe cubensis]KAH9483531.1 hypothetical protein JR316_0002999 [Psilocybe cubensis]